MARYGSVATRAVGLTLWEPGTSPLDAWKAAALRVYPDSQSARAKSCPKSAFLGLCEAGEVAGVPAGQYTRSDRNKDYALRALAALRRNPSLADEPAALWKAAVEGREIQENSQIEVVISLWQVGALAGQPAKGTNVSLRADS